MSGYNSIIDSLERMDKIRDELKKCKAAAAQIPNLEEEWSKLSRSLVETLKNADVASQGNFGWEGRIVNFLATLRSEIVSKERSNDT